MVPGVFLTFGVESLVDRVEEGLRVAFVGPVVNFEETRALAQQLVARHPDVAIVVVREQRSDLEDWVDEVTLHAVVSPLASDDELKEVIGGLARWLIGQGRAEADDFRPSEAADAQERTRAFAELIGDDAEDDEAPTVEASDSLFDDAEVGDAMLAALVAGTAVARPIGDGDSEAQPYEPADQVGPGPDDSMPNEGEEPEPSTPVWEFPPLESGQPTEAVAVVAPKGGQGKTTIAINLAAGLARHAPNSVVLVDADLQFGDITAALDLDPESTIVDATSTAAGDELILKTTLTHHAGGFFVVASAPSPELGDEIAPAALGRLITQLRGIFRYVIVDTTPGLGEHSLVVLEHVTDAVFVSNLGVPALRALRTELELLRTLGLLPANRRVVVNQTEKNAGITVKDAEQIIGAPLDVDIPRSTAVLLASNKGVPLIDDDPRDPAARALRALVTRIAPEAADTRALRRRR